MASQPQPRKIFWHLVIIFFLLSMAILVIGYFYYAAQARNIKKGIQNNLIAIMKLKSAQIVDWRAERVADAKIIVQNPFFASRVTDLLEGKVRPTPELEKQINERLEALRHYQYQKIELLDSHGEVRAAIPGEKQAIDPFTKKLALEALRTQKFIFSDLYRDKQTHAIHLSLLAPILLNHGAAKIAVGVILLEIDPYQFLYPLIRFWPTPSRTAETVLLQRDGNEVVLLNQPRFEKESPLSLRLPMIKADLLATMAARGETGVLEGLDYRGVPVLGAVGHISGSPWFLITKMDLQEIYAPIRAYSQMIVILLLTVIAGAGMGLAYIWRNQQAAFYRRQFQVERDQRVLAQRYEYLAKHANDIILLADEDLRIFEANDRALKAYGYTREELHALHLQDLGPPEAQALLGEQPRQALKQGGVIFETSQLRKDGTTFPVEISLGFMELPGQRVYHAMIRDITERKLAERALQRSEAHLSQAQSIAHMGSWEWNILKNTAVWSEEVYRIYGLPQHSPALNYEGFLECLHPDDRQRVNAEVSAAMKGEKPYRLEFRIIRPDGSVRTLYSQAEVALDASGQLASLVGIVQDITERKESEEALRKSEYDLRRLSRQLMTAQEAERRRISLALHDELGQALMILKFQMSTMRDQLPEDSQASRSDCEELLHYLDGLIDKVRQMSRDLSPPTIIDELGFGNALKYLIEQYSKHHDIHQSQVDMEEIDNLFSKPAEINIYRIFQEALTNIGRHAHATHLRIEIKKQGNQVFFLVRDNGKGFDPGRKSGIGLAAMKERVKILGGELEIQSQKAVGTSITFNIPIELK